jgi:hypothetical protein
MVVLHVKQIMANYQRQTMLSCELSLIFVTIVTLYATQFHDVFLGRNGSGIFLWWKEAQLSQRGSSKLRETLNVYVGASAEFERQTEALFIAIFDYSRLQ